MSFAENFALSGVAAIFSKTVAAPFDRVKLLVQCQGEMLKQGTIMRSYNGVIDCIVQIFRNEGLLSFYRGNLPACLRYFPAQVQVFFEINKIIDEFFFRSRLSILLSKIRLEQCLNRTETIPI